MWWKRGNLHGDRKDLLISDLSKCKSIGSQKVCYRTLNNTFLKIKTSLKLATKLKEACLDRRVAYGRGFGTHADIYVSLHITHVCVLESCRSHSGFEVRFVCFNIKKCNCVLSLKERFSEMFPTILSLTAGIGHPTLMIKPFHYSQ